MTYTLARGAHSYNNRLHYSLYGGVEFFPDRALAIKELLPLIAVPAIAIAMLSAMVNFHVPTLSPATGGSSTGATGTGTTARSLVLSSHAATTSTPPSVATIPTFTTTGTSGSPSITTTNLVPLGNDNGQGMLAEPIGSTAPAPAAPLTAPTDPIQNLTTTPDTTQAVDSTSVQVDTPLTQTGTDSQQPQAGVDIIAPLAGSTDLSASLSL